MVVDLTALQRALASLEAALTPPPRNDRERDGAIQRFEYTFELTWKTAMRVLHDSGIVARSPKAVIRELAQLGWVSDAEQWLRFLADRNSTTQIYADSTAQEVFASAEGFAAACRDLLGTLERQMD